jgi:formiminotetrahydrofolate cyclodeaminase
MSAAGSERPAALDTLRAGLGGEGPWPGAGAGAGMVVALAAGLIEAVAQRSTDGWDEARGATAQAAALRRRGVRLAGENAEAHIAARAALASASADKGDRDREIADIGLGAALALAAELPLRIAEAAVDVAELGALAAKRGVHDARADASSASLLAAGAAAAAAHLVEINLATQADDARIARARELVALARSASERALAKSA